MELPDCLRAEISLVPPFIAAIKVVGISHKKQAFENLPAHLHVLGLCLAQIRFSASFSSIEQHRRF
jgi:hypothetical protein